MEYYVYYDIADRFSLYLFSCKNCHLYLKSVMLNPRTQIKQNPSLAVE